MDEIDPSAIVRCARCGSHFLAELREIASKNRKATWSLILGIASCVGLFLTAIPAVILGVKALGDIKHNRSSVGKRRSWTGIISGVLFGLSCTAFAGLLAVIIPGLKPTYDPAEIAEIQAKIGQIQMPETLKPHRAGKVILGMVQVRYEDDPDISNAGLIYFPLSSGLNEQAVRAQVKSRGSRVFEMQDRQSKSIDAKCNERTLKISHEIGIDGDWEHHLYYTVLPGNDGNTLLVVKTERPLEGSKAADQEREGRPVSDYFIDLDAVKNTVESFSPAEPGD